MLLYVLSFIFLVCVTVIKLEDNKELRKRIDGVPLPKVKNYRVKSGGYGELENSCTWHSFPVSAVVRALAFHQCGPGSIPGPGVIFGLSLLLVLVLALRVFLRVLRFSSLHKNQHFIFQFHLLVKRI